MVAKELALAFIIVAWVSIAIFLILKVSAWVDRRKNKKTESVGNHFAIFALLFFVGFMVLRKLEYTGLAANNAITGLAPASTLGTTISPLAGVGLIIVVVGVILLVISKKSLK